MSMGMIMNIVFLLTCYPILWILYFLYRDVGEKNGYCFGATLKQSLREEPEVMEVTAEYKRKLKRLTILFGIIPAAFLFVESFSINMSLWMLWILTMCIFPVPLMAKANGRIQELKQERGWKEEYVISYADLKVAQNIQGVKLGQFLPQIVLSLIPIMIAWILFREEKLMLFTGLVALFGFCTVLFYLCAIWTDRQRIEVLSEDSDVNQNYARAKKQAWRKFWSSCAWINAVFTCAMLFLLWQRNWAMQGLIAVSIVYEAVLLWLSWKLTQSIRRINQSYESVKKIYNEAEDDSHWIWGLLYYNKNDKHYMVESRIGTGTTINLGNKAGMVTELFALGTLLLCPFLCIWMIMVEFTPISVSIEQENIVCRQLNVDYEIPLAQIESYEAVTELPEDLIKVSGIGMSNLLSGTFEAYRQGTFEMFVKPQNHMFLKITTESEVYYISGTDDAQTQDIWNAVTEYGKQ